MLTFFPATGGDDEEAVDIVTHGILQTVQNRPKKQKIPKSGLGRAQKALA